MRKKHTQNESNLVFCDLIIQDGHVIYVQQLQQSYTLTSFSKPV